MSNPLSFTATSPQLPTLSPSSLTRPHLLSHSRPLRLQTPRSALATPPSALPPSDHDNAITQLAPRIVGRSALDAAVSATYPSSSADALIVVVFHARWCRVCKTLLHKIPRIAPAYPNVSWFQVDFADVDNKRLCRDLGVKLLPTFRFYRPGMSIDTRPLEEFTSGPFGIKRVEERLEPYRPALPC